MASTISNPDAMRDRASKVDSASAKGAGRPGHGRARFIAGAMALSVATSAAGYVGGRVHAWSTVRETKAQLKVAVGEHVRAIDNARLRHREELARVDDELAQARRQREQLTKLAGLHEGLRKTQHALRALDARDFGVAQERLGEAQRILAPLSERVPRLEPVVRRLAATEVVVAGRLSEQRRRLADLVTALDDLVDREPAVGEPPATATDVGSTTP